VPDAWAARLCTVTARLGLTDGVHQKKALLWSGLALPIEQAVGVGRHDRATRSCSEAAVIVSLLLLH
jgi:hypothetical protein